MLKKKYKVATQIKKASVFGSPKITIKIIMKRLEEFHTVIIDEKSFKILAT